MVNEGRRSGNAPKTEHPEAVSIPTHPAQSDFRPTVGLCDLRSTDAPTEGLMALYMRRS